MSEHTNDTASVCRSHEHSDTSDSADKKESETMAETKYRIGQHVHVGDRPGIVTYLYVESAPISQDAAEPVYRVRLNGEDSENVHVESALSSCDLAAELSDAMAAARQAIADDPNAVDGILVWYPDEDDDDDDDHGPGCDGPLNCTCDAAMLRKLGEFDAVRETLDSTISALQRAAADLSKFEIDDYADTDVIASSAALEDIGNAAAALIGIVAVMCESHPSDGNWDDQGHCSAEQLRNGHAVRVVHPETV